MWLQCQEVARLHLTLHQQHVICATGSGRGQLPAHVVPELQRKYWCGVRCSLQQQTRCKHTLACSETPVLWLLLSVVCLHVDDTFAYYLSTPETLYDSLWSLERNQRLKNVWGVECLAPRLHRHLVTTGNVSLPLTTSRSKVILKLLFETKPISLCSKSLQCLAFPSFLPSSLHAFECRSIVFKPFIHLGQVADLKCCTSKSGSWGTFFNWYF